MATVVVTVFYAVVLWFLAAAGCAIWAFGNAVSHRQERLQALYNPPPVRRAPPAAAGPHYAPRWTSTRRRSAAREHSEWQKEFDRLYSWPAGPGVYRK